MDIKFDEVLRLAKQYEPDMTRFLRDMIAIPSESCQEEKVILRIKQEMEKVGFDKVEIDPMGNIFGYIGHGAHLIAMDAHVDTVGVGNPENWNCDPYQGDETAELIFGPDLGGKWEAALNTLGISPATLSAAAGRA